jgi:4-carboxymuconolactone decarboxylase
MNLRKSSSGRQDEGLGGRLPLLACEELDPLQMRLRDELVQTRVRDAADAGYRVQLPDGRLIGPFNAYLHSPEVGLALRQWAIAIDSSGLAAEVREVAILTVGFVWQSDFEIYAHAAEARRVGVPDGAIDAILSGRPPDGLSRPATIAHRLARSLMVDHRVDDTLYREATTVFDTTSLIALVSLVGRYMTTAAILACFEVPIPSD